MRPAHTRPQPRISLGGMASSFGSQTTFYHGQGMMFRRQCGIASLKDLDGKRSASRAAPPKTGTQLADACASRAIAYIPP